MAAVFLLSGNRIWLWWQWLISGGKAGGCRFIHGYSQRCAHNHRRDIGGDGFPIWIKGPLRRKEKR